MSPNTPAETTTRIFLTDAKLMRSQRDPFDVQGLEVRPSNTGAQTLYRKLGFRMIGLRKGYYTNPPEDAFVLALYL